MNILFVSHSNRSLIHLDPSVRYRCLHFAEELNRLGHRADLCHFRNFKESYLCRYDRFIFHKPRFSARLVRLVHQLKALKKSVWTDFDDLVFDETLADQSPLFLCGRASRSITFKLQREYRRALLLFDHVTVSTHPLAEHVERIHPAAVVETVPNGLSCRWVSNGKYMYTRDNGEKWIGYFPGTTTHHHDFESVARALTEFLRTHRQVRLLVMGPLDLSGLQMEMDRVITLPAVAYDQLSYWIMQCWLTIAPLSTTVFNQCKSRLKLIESAVWGVPLVASPVDDLKRCDTQVLYAADETQWLEGLEMLVDEDQYRAIASDNYHWASKYAMARNSINGWLNLIIP